MSKNTYKIKKHPKIKRRNFSKKTKKGGFIRGYNPIKGVQNIINGRKPYEPNIGETTRIKAIELQNNIQPLKDVEAIMDNIMDNIRTLKMECINDCTRNANNLGYEARQDMQQFMKNKDIYEWGNMCSSSSLQTQKCTQLLRNIRDMLLYIETIKELSSKAELYAIKLQEIQENIDPAQMDINESF